MLTSVKSICLSVISLVLFLTCHGSIAQDFTIAQNTTGNNRSDLRGQVFTPSQQEDGTGMITSTGAVFLTSFNIIYDAEAGAEVSIMYIYSTLPATTASLDDGTGGVLVGQSTSKMEGDFPYTNYNFDFLELDVNTTYYAVFRQDVQLEFGGSASADGPYAGGKMLKNDGVNVLENDFAALKFIGEFSNSPVPNQGDVDALKALYNSTDGANWVNKWDLNGDPNEWYQVTWENGRVARIILQDNNLSGSIPAELGNLTALTSLWLTNNRLTGTIPVELADLTNLEELILSGGELSGTIPLELSNMINLEKLSLGNNALTGSIPSELSNLSNLETLGLEENQFSGAIPLEIGNLNTLKYLTLGNNQISGSIPPEIGNLVSLERLQLANCQFTGALPPEIGNLTKLTDLLLYGNQFDGVLPNEITNISGLRDFQAQNNLFDFTSFEPTSEYLNTVSNLFISPQPAVLVENKLIVSPLGTEVIISIDTGGENNRYEWFLNGVSVSDISATPQYTIPSLSEDDLGTYYCKVSNTIVLALTLFSEEILLDYKVSFVNEPALVSENAISLDLESTVDKGGVLYYVALLQGSAVPNADQIIAGTNASNEVVNTANNVAMLKNVAKEFSVTNLTPNTTYDLYSVVEDENSNKSTSTLTLSTVAGIQFIEGFPELLNVNVSEVQISTSVSKNGNIFYVVLPKEDNAPSAAQVIAGTNASSATVTLSGSVAIIAETVTEVNINGLDDQTFYDIYLVAQDEESLMTEVVKLSAETITGLLENSFSSEQLEIYPNPVNSKLHIAFKANEQYDLTVTNVKGKQMFAIERKSGPTSIDVSKLEKGVYLLNIKTANKSGWMRFVKE